MQRLQAFKFELMPDGAQQRDMRRFSGSCRFVYNKALALQKTNYEAGGKFIGYVALAVKSRLIINTFNEQFWFFLLPFLECSDRGEML